MLLTRPWVHKQPPPPPFAHHFHHHHASTTTNSQPLYETPIYPEMGSGVGPGTGGIPAGSYHDSSGASHQVKLEATNFYLLKCLWIPSDSYTQFSVEWTAIFELSAVRYHSHILYQYLWLIFASNCCQKGVAPF